MSKVRVPLFKTSPVRSVAIEPDATRGATIGANVYNADGTLFDPAAGVTQIINQTIDQTGGTSDGGIALEDAQVAGDGLVAVAGSLAQGSVNIGLDLARAWMLAA
jgi:hypothetical protein